MSKKLEILLDAIEKGSFLPISHAYQAYMEERKKLPQQGDMIEVCNYPEGEWEKRKVVGFQTNGNVVTEKENGIICSWKHYRIPTPKKKWKVVKDSHGTLGVLREEHETDLPVITTFED